jgi:hypothetical protein
MAKMADVKQRGRSWLIGGALIVVGVLAGQALPRGTAAPAAETGTLTSVHQAKSGPGTTIGFEYKGARQAFVLGNRTSWQDKPGVWHPGGQPTCLALTAHTPQRITIGVITVQATGTLPATQLVVWVKCEG